MNDYIIVNKSCLLCSSTDASIILVPSKGHGAVADTKQHITTACPCMYIYMYMYLHIIITLTGWSLFLVLKQCKCLVVRVFIILHHTRTSLRYQQYLFVICFSSPRTSICDLICVYSVHFFLSNCNPNTKTLFQREICTCIATFLLESPW